MPWREQARRDEPGVRESTGQHHTDDASLRTMRMSRAPAKAGPRMERRPRGPQGRRGGALILDQANFTGAWTLGRFFDGEVDPLALPQ